MDQLSGKLVRGEFVAPWINKEWDQKFLNVLASGELEEFDSWTDDEVLGAAGYGGSEVRLWIAAAAAAQAYDQHAEFTVDYYSGDTTLAVGVGVVHGRLASNRTNG